MTCPGLVVLVVTSGARDVSGSSAGQLVTCPGVVANGSSERHNAIMLRSRVAARKSSSHCASDPESVPYTISTASVRPFPAVATIVLPHTTITLSVFAHRPHTHTLSGCQPTSARLPCPIVRLRTLGR